MTDLVKAPDHRPSTSPLSHVQIKLVNSYESSSEFMRWLGERRDVLGVDTESGGLRPHQHRLRTVQFGDMNTGWVLPWDDWRGLAKEVLTKYTGELALHNLKFDARFITHNFPEFKWPWDRSHDTMNQAHLLDPQRLKGLKPLSSMLIDPRASAAQRLLDQSMSENGWNWDTIPIEVPAYWVYAGLDPVLTCHLHDRFYPAIRSMYRDAYQVEMGTLRVAYKMERRGARIDPAYCRAKRAELTEWVVQAKQWLRDAYGIQNVNSSQQVIKVLDAHAIPYMEKYTDGGARSLDKEVVKSIDHDIGRLVLAIRKAEKNVGPYFDNFLEMMDENDRLHPSIWTCGTRTARMSMTDPALQTLPRKDPTVRTAFIPSEGNALVTCDADQIEARLAAHHSNDEAMIRTFRYADEQGGDFFCGLASQAFQTAIDKKDPRRQLMKNATYGKLFGAGIRKMAETAGVPYGAMRHVVEVFDATYPGIAQMQADTEREGILNGATHGTVPFIYTELGRYMPCEPGKPYTLVNYRIQNHAAEILKRNMIELDIVLPDDLLILPVHDEIVADVPAEDADEIARLIAETCTDRDSYRVPITWSADVLRGNWGDKYR